MNFMEFLEKTAPEDLQKLAEQAQDELVNKVMNSIIPLLEKQAEYTVMLIKQAMEGEEAPQEEKEEQEAAAAQAAMEPGTKPGTTQGEDNSEVVGSNTPEGLKATDIQGAVNQAIEAQQVEKVIPFVKALASAHPDALTEVSKIIKVCLHDAIMKRKVEPEKAAKVAQELDNLISGPTESGE